MSAEKSTEVERYLQELQDRYGQRETYLSESQQSIERLLAFQEELRGGTTEPYHFAGAILTEGRRRDDDKAVSFATDLARYVIGEEGPLSEFLQKHPEHKGFDIESYVGTIPLESKIPILPAIVITPPLKALPRGETGRKKAKPEKGRKKAKASGEEKTGRAKPGREPKKKKADVPGAPVPHSGDFAELRGRYGSVNELFSNPDLWIEVEGEGLTTKAAIDALFESSKEHTERKPASIYISVATFIKKLEEEEKSKLGRKVEGYRPTLYSPEEVEKLLMDIERALLTGETKAAIKFADALHLEEGKKK